MSVIASILVLVLGIVAFVWVVWLLHDPPQQDDQPAKTPEPADPWEALTEEERANLKRYTKN